MPPPVRYEILTHLPPYGPAYVPIPANSNAEYSEGFAVRFYKEDGSDWVANFMTGITNLKGVYERPDQSNLLIIANGLCYLMNPDKTTPLDIFGYGYDKILTVSDNRLILQNETSLTIVETNGTHWETERISWDGFSELGWRAVKDSELNNNVVKGLSYNPMNDANEWVPFEYNIDTKELFGGSFNTTNRTKPWWKFW